MRLGRDTGLAQHLLQHVIVHQRRRLPGPRLPRIKRHRVHQLNRDARAHGGLVADEQVQKRLEGIH